MNEIGIEKEYWAANLSSRLDDLSMTRMADMVMLDGPSNMRVGLELGCGEGRLLDMLPNLIGSDYSTLGLKLGADGKKPLVCADGSKLPFRDQSLDYVITNCLHHMPYRKVLHEVHRVLKEGGTLYSFEPNRWHIYNLLFNRRYGVEIVGDRGFFPHRLRSALCDSGLVPDNCQFVSLNMERVRLLARVQRLAQRIPLRLFQAWFFVRAVRI